MDNNFTGTVPERIDRLKSLRFLSLTNNSFTNALQVLKSAPSLTTLLIGANFRGEAMPEDETIDGYRSLQVLSLADCPLSGEIPRWVSGLENLRELFLGMKTVGNGRKNTSTVFIFIFNLRDENENGIYR
jgi:hypothetical protein